MVGMVKIEGATYPVRNEIKALGGRWDGDAKAWMVPADRADAARKLVAPKISPLLYVAPDLARAVRRATRCKVCGTAHGRILRSGECADCYEERRMGH